MIRLKLWTALFGMAALAMVAAPNAALAGDDAEPSGWTYNQGSGWTYSPGTPVYPTRSGTSQTPTYSGGWQHSKPIVIGGSIDPCLLLGTCP